MRVWYTYIMTNHTNTVLYTGITNNLYRRLGEHVENNSTTSFTSRYRIYKLIWYQEFPTAMEAINAEKKIKGWTRKKKIALICSINPTFRNLLAQS